ncbi:MAG: tetratricopeptide repeat protein [Armatimonadota bacterium]|nr:tetratricopeptide repeat protein [Armatimonadota bacterium]
MRTLAALLLLIPAASQAAGPVLAQSTVPQAQHLFEEARQAYAEGAVHKATDLYRKAIDADPRFVEAYLKLGELLAALGS